MSYDKNQLWDALQYIPTTNRELWVKIGAGMKNAGFEFDDFFRWSAHDYNATEKDCRQRWNSFRTTKANAGTIVNTAKDYGWKPKEQGEQYKPTVADIRRKALEEQKEALTQEYAGATQNENRERQEVISGKLIVNELLQGWKEEWADADTDAIVTEYIEQNALGADAMELFDTLCEAVEAEKLARKPKDKATALAELKGVIEKADADTIAFDMDDTFYSGLSEFTIIFGVKSVMNAVKAKAKKEGVSVAVVKEHFQMLNTNDDSNVPAILKAEKPNLKTEQLEEWVESQFGAVRLNELTQEIEFESVPSGMSRKNFVNHAPEYTLERLEDDYRTSLERITARLAIIAEQNRYHPIRSKLESISWDGVDRLPIILDDCLGLPKSDALSRILVHKWLLQCVAMLYNTSGDRAYGADGVLLLIGKQGQGKSRFFAKLATVSRWFGDGVILNPSDRDSVHQCTATWICELGEVDAVLQYPKRNAKLKAFLTCGCDTLRLPYAKEYTSQPRQTSFCATSNRTDLLTDEENRRWWSVPAIGLSADKVNRLDVGDVWQLWAQMKQELERNGWQSFRLSVDERNALSERNVGYSAMLKGELEVLDCLAIAEREPDNYIYQKISVTEWKLKWEALHQLDTRDITKALKKHGFEEKQFRCAGVRDRGFVLPVWDSAKTPNF